MKSCFFIGHRDADERLLPYLTDTAKRLVTDCGVTRFYVGGYGNFDRLSGKAVIALKNSFPDIRLFLVIPYQAMTGRITRRAWNPFRESSLSCGRTAA